MLIDSKMIRMFVELNATFGVELWTFYTLFHISLECSPDLFNARSNGMFL